jgi:hypothetical protein
MAMETNQDPILEAEVSRTEAAITETLLREVVNARDELVNEIDDEETFTKADVIEYVDKAIDTTLKTVGLTDSFFEAVNN